VTDRSAAAAGRITRGGIGRVAGALSVTHVLLVVVAGCASRLTRDNAGTSFGDWVGLAFVYALVVALPTVVVSLATTGLLLRVTRTTRPATGWPELAGLTAGPMAAAVAIAITNDGDANGRGYLAGCALLAAVSAFVWAGLRRVSAKANQPLLENTTRQTT
jgi:hypothetical protein